MDREVCDSSPMSEDPHCYSNESSDRVLPEYQCSSQKNGMDTPPTKYMPEAGSPDVDDSENLATKYELRPQTRTTNQSFPSTWIDQDNTGNYDPDEEQRKVRTKRSRVRFRPRSRLFESFGSDDEDVASEELGHRESPKLLVELTLASEAGKVALRACLSTPPARSELAHDDFSDGYRLRRKTKASKSLFSSNRSHSKPPSELDLPSGLNGHPVARGCWGCLNLGIRCPLLDDEHAWPCYTCSADDTDCELVTPPVHKRACEGCKRRRIACSYTYTVDYSGPCQECADDGHRCVAGPDKDMIPTRIRYDRDWVKNPPPPPKKTKYLKTYWTCMQCREGGRECSFTGGASGEDCTACEMAGSICIPEQTNTPPKSSTAVRSALPQKRRAVAEPVKQPSPSKRVKAAACKTQIETEQASPGTTKTFLTKLCHPIIFNNETVNGENHCNFCDGSNTAVLGLEQEEVEVIEWEDGCGLTGISGGHMADGTPSTRVCTNCTMQRVTITMCEKHELRPIEGAETQLLDADGALIALFSGTVRKKDRWCSICPALATYECETAGSMDAFGNPRNGCGLQLCETCMLSLTGVYDGMLQSMLGELEDVCSDERPLGLRADFELLKIDGLLMRYVLWANQQ